MKKSFLFFAALAAILSLSSCKKDFTPTPESGQNETSRQPARITVSVQGAPVTKADIATRNNEDRLNTVEVYVFDAQTGSITNGMLESYKKAEDAEILGEQHNNAKVTFNATTGKKHIYVVANAGNNYAVTPAAALAQTIATEEEFLATISRFNENAIASGTLATSLLMVGGSENVLTQGENNIDISLRRLVARVKIEKITGGSHRLLSSLPHSPSRSCILSMLPSRPRWSMATGRISSEPKAAIPPCPTAMSSGRKDSSPTEA